jgi:DNA-binding transcriptional ArsR family regulator
MGSDWSALYKTLSDPTRRDILDFLYSRDSASYTEIMSALGIANTGKLNYHLKMLGNLIDKNEQGKYRLTERGVQAVNLLKNFVQSGTEGHGGINLGNQTSTIQRSTAATMVGVLLIVVGAVLIVLVVLGAVALPLFAVTSVGVSNEFGFGQFMLEPNTSFFLTTVNGPGQISVGWHASARITLYLLNTSEYSKLFSATNGTYAMTVNSTPSQWIYNRTSAEGSFITNLPSEPYFLVVSSKSNVYVQNITVNHVQSSQAQGQQPWETLVFPFTVLGIMGAVGTVLVIVGVRLLNRRT